MAHAVKGGVDKARADIFRKGKKKLDHLPSTSDALQLHVMRADYQFKVWLHADKQCIQLFAGGWLSMGIGLAVAWSALPAVLKVCIELVACGCLPAMQVQQNSSNLHTCLRLQC